MLRKDTFATATTVVFGLGIVFLVVGTSQTFQSCIGEQYHAESGETLQNVFAQFWMMSRVGGGCIGAFVDANAEGIIALFTVILGIATWLLWRSTKKLVESADRNAERQLRAYVAVGEPKFGKRDPETVEIPIENNGQTPARMVVGHLNRRWVPFGEQLPNDFAYPDHGTKGAPTSVAVLNPGTNKTFTFAIDPNEIQRVRNGETALFLYGHIDYVDAFDRPRTSEFSYQYFPVLGEDAKDVGHSLLLQPTHNDAK